MASNFLVSLSPCTRMRSSNSVIKSTKELSEVPEKAGALLEPRVGIAASPDCLCDMVVCGTDKVETGVGLVSGAGREGMTGGVKGAEGEGVEGAMGIWTEGMEGTEAAVWGIGDEGAVEEDGAARVGEGGSDEGKGMSVGCKVMDVVALMLSG